MQRLDDVALYAGREKRVTALVARDRRVLRLSLALEHEGTAPQDTIALSLGDAALARRWLDGQAPPVADSTAGPVSAA